MTEENNLENASQDELVSMFVYSLMEDMGENPDDKEAHLALKQQVIAAINDAIIDALPTAQAEELNKLFEQGEVTPEKMSEIIAKAELDTTKITEETLDKLREDYIGEVSEEVETEEEKEEE